MKIHIVQKGDTLWELAKAYGVNFEELKAANSHLSSPDMIMPGMKIRIPTTAKAVKNHAIKKEVPIKEMKKEQKVETPYKEMSPKPMPVIKEDDHKPKMHLKPEMPMPQMPQMPQMTMPIMQAPTMEQEQTTYMTFNFPESESSESIHIHKEQPKEMPIQQPMIQQPIFQPVQMVPCFHVNPCCGGMHWGHHFMPMHHFPMMLPMGYPEMVMPMQENLYDCGCGGSNLQMPQMGATYPMQYGEHMNFQQGSMPLQQTGANFQPSNIPQMEPNMTFPTMPGFHAGGYPTPPGFGDLRADQDESSD